HGRKQADFDTISAEVRPGTVVDARWLALSANKTHGLRRTNDDKRRAVKAALQMRPDDSDRAIAEHVGVSNNMVSEYRARLSSEDSQPATRTGRDGRTIDTRNIGKNRNHPESQSKHKRKSKLQSQPESKPSPQKTEATVESDLGVRNEQPN